MQHLHFGFSYIGLIFLLMLFIPNIIWAKFKPQNYDAVVSKENKILVWFERIGEVLVTFLVLMFEDFNIKEISYWSLFLLFAFLIMILYEIYWIRYFTSERTLKDFYSSILGIPVAGATLPILAMLLLSIYGKNIFLLAATLILGIGHIGIHLQHKKELKESS
ncbi:MAG: hypothetical protein K2K48_01670 [Anaeroplasmataceae bacterium]|nr:hypothetical protein [Anaeroplasmataceae bacterium]MDE6414099.1 hypothetical protein [Anaeroplasmataceae bacterium]